MKYGDELDRMPADGVSRRQFLTAGGQRAARLAAGLLPEGAERLIGAPPQADAPESAEESSDGPEG